MRHLFWLLCTLLLPAAAFAQAYPSRPITIIVPYAAGGTTDVLARIISKAMTEKLGQSVVVENVGGAGGTVGTQRVVRADPDGYTLSIGNMGSLAANVSLYPSLPFDTEKDLTPIIFVNNNPLVLVGRKTLEANTLKELVELGRKRTLKMAHPGVGATGHLATSLFAQEAKLKVDHIPYRGAAPALQDITGGHVDLFFATPQSVVQAVSAGQMKAYGITAKEPSPLFPNVPSFVQQLGPKLEILYWHALFAPGATPTPVLEKINAAVQEIISDPAVLKAWADTGVSPYPKEQRSVAAARQLLKSEITRWGQVVRDNNIQLSQ